MEHDLIDTAALAAWLGASAVEATGGPSGGGWSNETVFVVADGRRLVVRLTPRGRSMFPTYDLSHQVEAMGRAAAHGLPVPAILGDEPDPTVLGRPFFVMEHVAGRVPADDDPPFTSAGFLFEAPPGLQRRFHDAAVDAIAAVHSIPASPPANGEQPANGAQPADHLDVCRRLAVWCEWVPDVVFAAHDVLAAAVPTADPTTCSMLWGDARPANMVVDDDFAIVALLDWELAATGPGEFDVAWFCEMNRMRSTGMGIAPLPGFPDDDSTWRRWQDRSGRAARDIGWYRLFSAFRVATLMQLYLAAMIHRGRLPAGHRLLGDNPGTRRLHELLDRPVPTGP